MESAFFPFCGLHTWGRSDLPQKLQIIGEAIKAVTDFGHHSAVAQRQGGNGGAGRHGPKKIVFRVPSPQRGERAMEQKTSYGSGKNEVTRHRENWHKLAHFFRPKVGIYHAHIADFSLKFFWVLAIRHWLILLDHVFTLRATATAEWVTEATSSCHKSRCQELRQARNRKSGQTTAIPPTHQSTQPTNHLHHLPDQTCKISLSQILLCKQNLRLMTKSCIPWATSNIKQQPNPIRVKNLTRKQKINCPQRITSCVTIGWPNSS